MNHCASSKFGLLLLLLVWIVLHPAASQALDPSEVVVVVNVRVRDSLELAEHYMRKRRIPLQQLIRLGATTEERCSRQEYDEQVRQPVRQALARIDPNKRIRCLVVMYGVPLAIKPSETEITFPWQSGATGTQAAVDSELALVRVDDYPLDGWLPNPYFLGFRAPMFKRDDVLIVSRLDGPDPNTVLRLIDDAGAVEQQGLQGIAYFDARWPKPESANLEGYALYDASIHKAAEAIRKYRRMEVRLDAREELLQPGEAPQAALYCGWYSLGRYIDAFSWARGAIGYHIASAECTTLRRRDAQVWCKRMLEDGVAATIGPVNEPYVQGFPLPELFFSHLSEGYLSLGESYLVSLPYLSWQMVLIGDPLYQPFSPQ